MNTKTLAEFGLVFGSQSERLRGVTSWEQVPLLGKGNIDRLLQLSRENAMRLLGEGGSRDELREVQTAIQLLSESLVMAEDKPQLPRLRVESFRTGGKVHIYFGDTVGLVTPRTWVSAVVRQVDKAFRPDWNDGSPNGGYFWRRTADTAIPVFPGEQKVRFSTSEPRVLLAEEFAYLQKSIASDPLFLTIFCANAWRTWGPLWCLEHETLSSGGHMDMRRWIEQTEEVE
ncbi:MAG: hypothetical protein V4671_17895 [Armatimonadota bacterium]